MGKSCVEIDSKQAKKAAPNIPTTNDNSAALLQLNLAMCAQIENIIINVAVTFSGIIAHSVQIAICIIRTLIALDCNGSFNYFSNPNLPLSIYIQQIKSLCLGRTSQPIATIFLGLCGYMSMSSYLEIFPCRSMNK